MTTLSRNFPRINDLPVSIKIHTLTLCPAQGKERAMDHAFYMSKAIEAAGKAAAMGEVPVGAVVTQGEHVLVVTHNLKESLPSGLAHAEVLAIEATSKQLGRWRLNDCTLYVTLEPCLMCCGAIISSRIGRVVFGAYDPKAGAVESLFKTLNDPRLNHRPEVVGGVMADECGRLLKDFFARRRSECYESPSLFQS